MALGTLSPLGKYIYSVFEHFKIHIFPIVLKTTTSAKAYDQTIQYFNHSLRF